MRSCASAFRIDIDGDSDGRLRLSAFRHIDLGLEKARDLVPGDEAVVTGRNITPREASVRCRPGVPGTRGHYNRGVHIGVDVTIHLHDAAVVEFHRTALALRIKAEIKRLSLGKRKDV